MCLHPRSSDHRSSVPLGLFCPVSKAHDSSWLERSREGGWHLVSGLVVWFFRTCGWVVIGIVLRWGTWGWVTHLTSGSWEGLSCSLLPPDSPSGSLTDWALAQVPEMCSARASGSQRTCLEPCLWSPGPFRFHIEGVFSANEVRFTSWTGLGML